MKSPSLLSHLRDVLILPFTVTVIVPYFIYNADSSFIPDNIALKIIGLIFFLGGLSLLIYTIFLFRSIGKGTLAPWSPTQKLVIAGPYRYCRNPMISGVFFILIGEALFFHAPNLLIWAGTFFIINTLYFIFKEEPSLEKRFGAAYRHYKTTVPRWIPKWKPYQAVE